MGCCHFRKPWRTVCIRAGFCYGISGSGSRVGGTEGRLLCVGGMPALISTLVGVRLFGASTEEKTGDPIQVVGIIATSELTDRVHGEGRHAHIHSLHANPGRGDG